MTHSMNRRQFREWTRENVVAPSELRDVEVINAYLRGERLHHMRWQGVHFQGFGFEGVRWKDCHLEDLSFDAFQLVLSGWEDTTINHCTFTNNLWKAVTFRAGTHVSDITFQGVLTFVRWLQGARMARANLRGVNLHGCSISDPGTSWLDCDLRDTSWTHAISQNNDGSSTSPNRFAHAHVCGCDFRGADFQALRILNTTFEGCAFHGILGAPEFLDHHGTSHFIDCDLSPDFDGSRIVSHEEALAFLTDPASR